MNYPNRFYSLKYAFFVSLVFLAGCLFLDSSASSNNITPTPMDSQCNDNLQNGDETGVDCGGMCKECLPSSGCDEMSCPNGFCENGKCMALCASDDGSCNPVVPDGCSGPEDCDSNLCQNGQCAPPHCNNQIVDPNEDAMDCGGACPLLCAGETCGNNTECVSDSCLENGVGCAARSCWDAAKSGEYTLAPAPGESFRAYCDQDAGWTLLIVSRANSINWSFDGDYWEKDPVDLAEESVGNPSIDRDAITPAYRRLKTQEIKLCYKDNDHCFVFDHGRQISLKSFFVNGESFVAPNAPESYLDALGFSVITAKKPSEEDIDCFELAINHERGRGRIGLLGEVDCGIPNVWHDDLGLGLGMSAFRDGQESDEPLDPPRKAGDARHVTTSMQPDAEIPNDQTVGPWIVYGR